MRDSSKNQVAGKAQEMKGKVQQKVGRATGDPNLEAKGMDNNVGGKIRKKAGQIERVFEK